MECLHSWARRIPPSPAVNCSSFRIDSDMHHSSLEKEVKMGSVELVLWTVCTVFGWPWSVWQILTYKSQMPKEPNSENWWDLLYACLSTWSSQLDGHGNYGFWVLIVQFQMTPPDTHIPLVSVSALQAAVPVPAWLQIAIFLPRQQERMEKLDSGKNLHFNQLLMFSSVSKNKDHQYQVFYPPF